MDPLPALLLTGAIFVGLHLLLRPRTERRTPGTAVTWELQHEHAAPVEVVEWDVFALPLVRRRLDAIADELVRLEHDPDIFAKAFHTHVAEAAFQALLAEESRIIDSRRRPVRGGDLAVMVGADRGSSIEVLEL